MAAESFLPPVVANFVANYAEAIAGTEAIASSLESIGPAAEMASATGQAALDRLAVSVDALDGQMSLFGEQFKSEGGQFALFGASADAAATQVEGAVGLMDKSLGDLQIKMAGTAAAWDREWATMSATMDSQMAGIEAAQARAVTANEAIATSGLKTASAEQETMAATGTAMMGLGTKIGLVAAAGIAATTDMAATFDQKMELIRTNDHDTTDSLSYLEQQVLQMAPAVGQMPNALADGLYHIISTGQRGKEALDILNASAKDATIGIASLDSVTYAMSGVMSVGMKDVTNAADGVAYLNNIVGQGDMKMQDLATAVGTGVLPVFKNAGLGMVDFGAALATITDNSTPAEVAANHLKTSIQLLQNQSAPAAKALGDLGIRNGELASEISKPGGLLIAVEDLRTHLDNYAGTGKTTIMTTDQINAAVQQMAGTLTAQNVPVSEQTDLLNTYRSSLQHMGSAGVQAAADLSKAFGGARSAMTMETLVGEVDKLRSKYGEMGTTASRAAQQQRDWNETQAQFKVKAQDAKAGLDALGISIGQYLLPFVSRILGAFASFGHFLSEHAGLAKALAIVLGGALVTAVGLLTGGFIMLAIAIQGTPIGWIFDIGLALTALIALIVGDWGNISGFFSDVWNDITGIFWGAVDGVGTAVMAVVHFFENLPGNIWNAITALPGILGRAASAAGTALLDGLRTAGTAVLNVVKNLPYDIGFAIGALAGILARVAVDAGVAFWHGLVTAFDAVKTFFTNLPSMILGLITSIAVWLVTSGSDLIHGLRDGILRGFLDVASWFEALPGRLTGFLASAGVWLVTHGMDLLRGFKNGIVQAFWDVANWLTVTLPNSIRGFFSDAINWLVNAGSELVHGLLRGIENAASWLWTQLKNFAQGVINGFLSFFGVHSPATTMEPVGKGLVDGIAHYLGAYGPNAINAAKTLAGQVTGAMTGMTGSASFTATGGGTAFSAGNVSGGSGGTVININPQGHILTDSDLQDLMLELFEQRGVRNGGSNTFPAFRNK